MERSIQRQDRIEGVVWMDKKINKHNLGKGEVGDDF